MCTRAVAPSALGQSGARTLNRLSVGSLAHTKTEHLSTTLGRSNRSSLAYTASHRVTETNAANVAKCLQIDEEEERERERRACACVLFDG